MLDDALLLLSSELAHDIRLSVGVQLLQNSALVSAVYQQGQHCLETVFVVCVNDVVFLQWLQVQSLLSEALSELLVGVVKVQELLFNYFDVVWVF
jgi:uncharacterized Fe-S center protein